MGPAGARHYAHTDRSADVGTCLTTPRGVVVSGAASLYGRQYRGWVLPAVSRGRGSGTVAVAGKGAGGPHAVSTMDRAGATDSYRGGEGDGARGVAYGAISRSGSLFLGLKKWGGRGMRRRRHRQRVTALTVVVALHSHKAEYRTRRMSQTRPNMSSATQAAQAAKTAGPYASGPASRRRGPFWFERIQEFYRQAAGRPIRTGVITAHQTFGDMLRWNPHHGLRSTAGAIRLDEPS